MALEIAKGTVNTIVDGSNGSQKAAIYCKGHLEIDKTGTLNVTGNTAHAISAKEYIQLKKSDGIINILGAKKDGIHCKQYFLGKGFTVNISSVADDAIQSELDGEANEDGYSDGSLNVNGGTYTLNTTSNGCKCLSADGNVNITDGTFTLTQTGSYLYDGTDISYPTAIKSDSTINISGGNITINNTANGGKGLSAEKDVNISGDATVLDITANGVGGSAVVNAESSGSTSTETETVKSYKVYVAMPSTGSTGGWGGGMGQSQYWTTLYLYKSDGTLVQQLTSTVSKTSGTTTQTFYYYDFKAADSGTYYFKSADYTSRNNGSTYAIKSSTFTGPTSGEDYYYSISNSYSTSGTTRTFSLSNVTSTWSGAEEGGDDSGKAYKAAGIKADADINIAAGTISITTSGAMSRGVSGDNVTIDEGTLTINNSGAGMQGTNDSYTSKGIKADTQLALNAGTITIKMTGNGGKGIKSSGTFTEGKADGTGPVLTVSTTGSSFGTSSSSSGGFGPGGMESSGGSSAKAIKVQGQINVYGGTTVVSTATDGAEGLESKTGIKISGGNHYYKCYDDCINSSGIIEFAGGNTVCYGFGNDAVDSNYGKSGAITISGGNIFSYTTKGSPEEGLDCDNNSYIKITGGIAVSAGAAQGGSSSSSVGSSSQGYYLGSSPSSYGSTYYYTLCNTSGTPVCTYKFEANCSNSMSLLTASNLGTGSVTVKYGTSKPTAYTSSVSNASGTQVFFVAPTVTTTGTTTTVTAK